MSTSSDSRRCAWLTFDLHLVERHVDVLVEVEVVTFTVERPGCEVDSMLSMPGTLFTAA
ncbi:MAG: hypothetical protein U1E47_01400 [Rivihabitans pingtungensis]